MKGSGARRRGSAKVAWKRMSHRFTTWWRALSVVLLSLATVTWPSAARADTSAHFDVVHQQVLTTLSRRGTTHFATTVRLSPASATAMATVIIYPRLVTRLQLAPIIAGTGTTAKALSSTGPFALRCLRHGEASFDVTLATKARVSPARSCDGVRPRLRLACTTQCAGVYPLRYSLKIDGARVVKWSLLVVRSGAVVEPLQVVLIATLTRGALSDAQHSIDVLDALGDFASSPISLSADYDTLAPIDLSPNRTPWKAALDRALRSPTHRAVDAPPASVDFAGLVKNGLTTQVAEQLGLSSTLLTSLTGHLVDNPILFSGDASTASLAALAKAAVNEIVLPESDLRVAPSDTLTWGAPFHVAGVGSITALSVDGPLSELVSNSSIEPGRRAALTLATLAFLHFEEPYLPEPRTVVVELPVASTSRTFVIDLLAGLQHDPFSKLAPLAPSFDPSLVGANGAPTTRALATSLAPAPWSSRNVASLLTLIGAVNSYARGVKSGDVAVLLRVAVAHAEDVGSDSARQSAIDKANSGLSAQLGLFSIDAGAITLAGPGNALPITIISHATYTMDAVAHLSTDGLSFPQGDAVPVTMSSSTTSLRVSAADPRGSSLTLQVVLTTPNDQVVLARTAIQVHIAGTSAVGYLLTFASLFVLGLWWWRTNRRRPKGRHAR